MGCDIHAFLEVKFDGAWHSYSELDFGRNYELFARMADVRNYDDFKVQPIDKPRGLPADASALTRFTASKIWAGDGHSHSWLNVEEMQGLETWFKERHGSSLFVREHRQNVYLFGNDITSWWEYPSDRAPGVEDIRLVFWFDN